MPWDEKKHVLHSRSGRIGGRADTTVQDLDRLVAALKEDSRGHLVIHFHGGLVSKAAGLEIARSLYPVYSPEAGGGGYPVFFVWESSAWEAIRNNLTELADEPVFKQLLRKLTQYALEKIGAVGGVRSLDGAAIGAYKEETNKEFQRFWESPSSETIPFWRTHRSTTASRSAQLPTEEQIQADLEQDYEVLRALATLPGLPVSSRTALVKSGSTPQERTADFSYAAAATLGCADGARGFFSLLAVARFVLRVLRNVIRRFAIGRDHGLYATCIEELVRGFKIGGSAANEWAKALEWNRMKKDTEDAFGLDPNLHVGTALLTRVRLAIDSGWTPRRITLIGHSTGAIYIANWLDRAKAILPPFLKHDVVFLAPAITYDRWAETLANGSDCIGRFRMFAMKDELEREDQVWGDDTEIPNDWRRFIYPSSLLYLVSGILEGRNLDGNWVDEPDMPLVGMQRYFTQSAVYRDEEFKSVQSVRRWLAAERNRAVWSITAPQAEPGCSCESNDHGAFDNDGATLESLTHFVG